MVVALGLWVGSGRPQGLISSDGVLVGLMGPEGRALSAPRGSGFSAKSWLEDDGDLTLPEDAAARVGFSGPKAARAFKIAGFKGEVLAGKAALAQVAAACARADIVVVPVSLGPVEPLPAGCLVIDRPYLDRSGAIALQVRGDGLHLVPVRRVARIWLGARPVAEEVVLPLAMARVAQGG